MRTCLAHVPWVSRCFAVLLISLPPISNSNAADEYILPVEKFADTMLANCRDRYGDKHTAVWAGVVDTRDLSVPRSGVPPPPGVREGDRSLGGSNLYHDCVTLRVFPVLSAVTGQIRYADAARAYIRDYLAGAQHNETGLLAWGEHCFYDMYYDHGTIPEEYRNRNEYWHELIDWTPPWPELWAVDSNATTAAIAGLRYHFYTDKPGPEVLYNRHAHWDKPVFQSPGQPWIKHSGLFAYSFAFLHAKTGNPKWLDWTRHCAGIYWNARDPKTGLTPSCIGDPREVAVNASAGMAQLGYWLYKAWQINPAETTLRERALALFKAYERYGFNKEGGFYYSLLRLDGTPAQDKQVGIWGAGYGEGGLLPYARVAAFFAKHEGDADCLSVARRVAKMARETPQPDTCVPQSPAYALNLVLDLYDLTGEREFLNDARKYADWCLATYSANGLFRRQAGDPYFESKLGTGDLLAGLVRLHLRLNPGLPDPGLYDWTF